jgi:serine phosphatase RsbU (regulator of sigma subunit)
MWIVAREHPAPGEVVAALDRAAADIAGAYCTTLGYGDYHPPSRTVRYLCAGHPAPLLLTAGEVRFLDAGRGTPLGVLHRTGRRPAELVVPAGSMLVWYTDGLIERRGESLDVGSRRLIRAAGQIWPTRDPAALRDHLLASLAPERPHADDVAIVCLYLP